MPWYLGELPFRRLCRESDGERAEHPRQHGLRLPLRCRNYTERFHHRDTRHLLYHAYNEKFANGASRYLSHDLTDLIQSNIVRDVRTLYEPQWTRRGKWNQSYYEARVPRVPTMLLELLSHQTLQTCATDWTRVSVSP